MSRKCHTWKKGHEPPPIRPHSLAKHRVLRAYLERYVSVLTDNPRQKQLRLTLVDGFAGGGKYLELGTRIERPGSPIIMLEAMKAAEVAARASRRLSEFNLNVEYFFIEKSKGAIAYLKSMLTDSEHCSLVDTRIHLINGEFFAQVPKIIDHVKSKGRSGRAIWVLDQCGYLDAPLPTIATILRELPNAEVILTFATDFLIDYLNETDQTQARIKQLGVDLPSTKIRDAKVEREWRRLIQFFLHNEIPERTGAAHYTPFFIRSPDSNRDFWLVHLSGHPRARDVMVGLHWAEHNSFAHYGKSGLRMLGYDPEKDEAWTKQKMLPAFYFDDTAKADSEEELLEQLPQQLYQFADGISFDEAFAKLTNETPVTSDIMKGVLNELARQGVIKVRDLSGAVKRRAGVQHDDDVIVVSRQKRLYFPPSNP